MSTSVMQNERLVELLVLRAIEGLTTHERAELKRLLAEESYLDAGRFEQTAAELLLGGTVVDETIPEDVQDRLFEQAASFDPATARVPAVRRVAKPRTMLPGTPRPRRTWTHLTAGLAVAASLLIAVAGWWPRLWTSDDVEDPQIAVDAAQALKREREELLVRQGVVQRAWQQTEDPAASGVQGDVVWDPQAQEGFVRFRGLQANDARQLQYQLWIFDATRGDQYPIDGGVFDIPSTADAAGEVIVPIVAKLPVGQAAMFAVTIEKPGGVVVSSRERIVVVAPVAAG